MKKLITGLIALAILVAGQTVFADTGTPSQTVPINVTIPQKHWIWRLPFTRYQVPAIVPIKIRYSRR